MNTRQNLLLAAMAAFASGLLTGLLLAPESGRDIRRRLARTAQSQSRRLGDHLHAVEEQLQAVSHQFGKKVRETTRDALDQLRPSIPEDKESWRMEPDELTRNLRRMPRR